MKYLITLILLSLTIILYAQKKEDRKIESFDKIDVFGNIEVIMSFGAKEELRIETKNIDPSEISTQVKDKLLKIKMNSNLFDEDTKVKVFVTYKELREISSNASAVIKITNVLNGDKVFANATSGGIISLKVDVNAIELKAYQGAHIEISGKTKIQESFINTGGILSGSNFESDEVFIRMNTGGKAEIIVKNRIEANVNTGADLSYFGKPEKEDLKTSLGGKIIRWDKD